jgi:Na+/proline symporter
MRIICFLFLVVFVGLVGMFAYQNNRPVDVTVWDHTRELTLPLLVGGSYLLGMLSGWTVVGMVRRSYRRVTDGLE